MEYNYSAYEDLVHDMAVELIKHAYDLQAITTIDRQLLTYLLKNGCKIKKTFVHDYPDDKSYYIQAVDPLTFRTLFEKKVLVKW